MAVGDCDAAVWDSASVRDGLRGYYRHKHSLALHWNNKAAVDGVGANACSFHLPSIIPSSDSKTS